MSPVVKAHRLAQLQVRSDDLKIRQLVYRSYQRCPADAPHGPHSRPACERGAPARVAQAVGHSVNDSARSAPQVLNSAWAHFIGFAELELSQRLAVEPTDMGGSDRE